MDRQKSYRALDNLRPFEGATSIVGERVMIDPSAVVLGDIELGDDVSIWPQCAIRADMHHIRIGQCTNVQDGAVLHITHASNYNPDGWPLTIGSHVTIGHGAILHGCTIGNHVLVGMRATVMDGAVVEDEVMLAAGCLVTPNKHCESGFVYAGSPGKKLRPLTDAERRFLHYSAENYVRLKDRYLQQSPSHAE